MTIDHDRLFKELLTTFFREFLELFVPEALHHGVVKSVAFTDKEIFRDLPGMERRQPDLVAKVEFAGGGEAFYLVHVEVQSQVQPDFARRMFFYFSRLHEAYRAPVYPIAVFAYDTVDRDEPSAYTVTFPDFDVLRFSFVTIPLRKLNWRAFLQRRNPVAAALMAKMGYRRDERARVKAECLRLLATLELGESKTRLIGRFVEAYLPLDADERSEYNKVVEGWPMTEKQAVSEILTFWERQGLEKGREEGRCEGLRQIIMRLLEQRFDGKPVDSREELDKLSADELEHMTLAVNEVSSYLEWKERLEDVLRRQEAPSYGIKNPSNDDSVTP